MVDEKRNNQQFQQHHTGGIVQGIPPMTSSYDFALAPQTGVSQGYFPAPRPPSTLASAPCPQNHAPRPRPPSQQVSEMPSNTSNINSPAVTASATANSTTVIVNPGPSVIEVKDDRLSCGCGSGWII